MSLAINIRAEVGKVDGKRLTAAMDRELEKLFHEAARAFLIAAVRRIPVRTGFLRGAFTRLEDVIGAFEFSQSTLAKRPHLGTKAGRASKLGTRPGKGSAETALRLVRARQRQEKLIRRIQKLRQREAARHQKLVTTQDELRKNKEISPGQKAAKEASIRGKALRERRLRQSFIRQAQQGQANIEKLVSQVEKKYKISLGDRLGDATRANELALEAFKERREQKFFRVLKNLNARRFGHAQNFTFSKNANPSIKGRIASTLSEEEYQRRVTRLRASMKGSNVAMQRIENRLNEINLQQARGLNPKRLTKLRARLQQKLEERAAKAGIHEDEIEAQAQKEVQQALLRKIKRDAARASAGHPLLALAAERRRIENLRNSVFSSKRATGLGPKGSGEVPLNIVAKVSGEHRHRIVGQTVAGKFNLRPGEHVLKEFKLIEFYYPNHGRAGRIQKTPRSGRRYATPASEIITKVRGAPKANAALFQQLAGFLKASGKPVSSDVVNAAKDLENVNTQYVFNFGVAIKYLPINDIKQLWFAWNSGIRAFQAHLNGNLLQRIPKMQDYMLTETHKLTGNSRSVSVRRG